MPRSARRLLACAVVAVLAGCGAMGSKPDEEAAKNTFACDVAGERVVVRFERGEVRLLFAGNERVTLYQVPSASGVRYTNGSIDVTGKGLDLQMTRDGGTPVAFGACAPYTPPKT